MSIARFVETPWDAIPRIASQTVLIGDQRFEIHYPGDWDALLDHPTVIAAFAKDEYLPYWADLWPAAKMLAAALCAADLTTYPSGLELGCGLGLPGIAALSKGVEVTFSDYDRTALRFAADNANRNGFRNVQTSPLDWRDPPRDWRFPLIFGSDLIYEDRNHEPLLNLIDQILEPQGLFLLSDPNRLSAPLFRDRLDNRGLSWKAEPVTWSEGEMLPVDGTIYWIYKS